MYALIYFRCIATDWQHVAISFLYFSFHFITKKAACYGSWMTHICFRLIPKSSRFFVGVKFKYEKKNSNQIDRQFTFAWVTRRTTSTSTKTLLSFFPLCLCQTLFFGTFFLVVLLSPLFRQHHEHGNKWLDIYIGIKIEYVTSFGLIIQIGRLLAYGMQSRNQSHYTAAEVRTLWMGTFKLIGRCQRSHFSILGTHFISRFCWSLYMPPCKPRLMCDLFSSSFFSSICLIACDLCSTQKQI